MSFDFLQSDYKHSFANRYDPNQPHPFLFGQFTAEVKAENKELTVVCFKRDNGIKGKILEYFKSQNQQVNVFKYEVRTKGISASFKYAVFPTHLNKELEKLVLSYGRTLVQEERSLLSNNLLDQFRGRIKLANPDRCKYYLDIRCKNQISIRKSKKTAKEKSCEIILKQAKDPNRATCPGYEVENLFRYFNSKIQTTNDSDIVISEAELLKIALESDF